MNLRRYEKDHQSIVSILEQLLEKHQKLHSKIQLVPQRDNPLPSEHPPETWNHLTMRPTFIEGQSTRSYENMQEVLTRYEQQITLRTNHNERSLMEQITPTTTTASEHVIPPHLVKKEEVLLVLQQMIETYEIISHHEQWKTYGETLRDNMKSAFSDYCQAPKPMLI